MPSPFLFASRGSARGAKDVGASRAWVAGRVAESGLGSAIPLNAQAGRSASRVRSTSSSVAAYDDPLHFRRPPEQHRRPLHLTGVDELPDPARGDVLDQRHPPHVKTEPVEQREIALAPTPEAERLPG